MSDWIKENKFAAGLLLVAIVAIIGTYFFAGSKTKAYDDAKLEYDTKSGEYSSLSRVAPYPDAGNLEDYRKDVVAFRGQVEGMQNALVAFRPEEFKKVRPAEFVTRINQVVAELKGAYDANGIAYPEKWQLGFEDYTSSPPRDGATDYLSYQLDALNWLYLELAKSGPSELLNVYRAKIPVEEGQPMGGQAQRGKGKGRNAPQGNKPYHALPVELTFRGRESALRSFLNQLTSSKEYFFVVRSVRVQNTKPDVPPKVTDAKFDKKAPAPAGGDDPFGDFEFVIPGEESSEGEEEGGEEGAEGDGEGAAEEAAEDPIVEPAPAPAGGERTLGQVLGGEELNVLLQLELILFRDDVKLPEVK